VPQATPSDPEQAPKEGKPGFTWARGYWHWDGVRQVWQRGRWEANRSPPQH
jgi:hypothetical protein